MKKTKIIIAVVAVLVVAAIAAVVIPMLTEEKVPEGMVKVWLLESCKRNGGEGTEYSYGENGMPTRAAFYNANNEKISEAIYNENGKVASNITFVSGQAAAVTNYEYNEEGLITRVSTAYNGQTVSDMTYTYNEDGDPVKVDSKQNGVESVFEYQYASKGKPLVVIESTAEGERTRQEYEYADDGTLVLKTVYQGGTVVYTIEYEYGANGESYVEKKTSADDSYREIHGHRYDENGRKTEFRLDGTNGENTYLFTYLEDGRLDTVENTSFGYVQSCKYKSVAVSEAEAEELQKIQDTLLSGLLYEQKLQ